MKIFRIIELLLLLFCLKAYNFVLSLVRKYDFLFIHIVAITGFTILSFILINYIFTNFAYIESTSIKTYLNLPIIYALTGNLLGEGLII
jgi:hypothetical protein